MNMKRINYVALLSILLTEIAVAGMAKKSMPPVFSINQDAEKILQTYPLGSLEMQEVFAHHGGPDRKLILPNGNKGWLYAVGNEAGIPNIYILQFSGDGKVIDVFHKSLHYKNGHSALQYQFLQAITPELKITGPGPGE